MDTKRLVRDADRVKKALVEKDGRLMTPEGCKIYFPRHYASGALGSIESAVRVIGIYALVVNDQYYAVNKTCATMTFTPTTINVVKVDEVDYLELVFDKGATVMPGLDLVQNGPLLFNIYDEIVSKGKTPWYLNYVDIGTLFDSARYHGGVSLGADHAILEMITATRARDPSNRVDHFRHLLKSPKDVETLEPDIIPLRSVAFGATNTTARLLGAYLNEGMTSALTNPTEKLERVEELLLS